jgi:hypothetical protein
LIRVANKTCNLYDSTNKAIGQTTAAHGEVKASMKKVQEYNMIRHQVTVEREAFIFNEEGEGVPCGRVDGGLVRSDDLR